SPRDLRRQLAYALPFGAAFALIIPQQQFHSYLVSASVTAAAFAVYAVGCFQLPIVDMLYTPVSEILQLGIAEHEAKGDNEGALRSEEHTSELQSRENLVCRLLLEKKNRH